MGTIKGGKMKRKSAKRKSLPKEKNEAELVGFDEPELKNEAESVGFNEPELKNEAESVVFAGLELRKEVRMTMRWLECGAGSIHIVGPCPDCYATQGGLLLGTAAGTYRGRLTARCIDCGKAIDYYVDSPEGRIWMLQPIESKGARLETD